MTSNQRINIKHRTLCWWQLEVCKGMSPRPLPFVKPATSTIENLEILQRVSEKCKQQQVNTVNVNMEKPIEDAQKENRGTANSFKDALMNENPDVNLANECWSELIEENFP